MAQPHDKRISDPNSVDQPDGVDEPGAINIPATVTAFSGAGDLGLSSSPMVPLTVENMMDEALGEISPTDQPLTPYHNVTENAGEKQPPTPYDNVPDDPLSELMADLKIETTNNNVQSGTDAQNNNESRVSDKEIQKQISCSSNGSDTDSDEYDFTHQFRGTALIFSFCHFAAHTKQSGREGAIEETKKLKKLMKCLGFNAILHPDVTREELFKILDDAATEDHSNSDCFACILSSHGTQVAWYKEKHVKERTDIIFTNDGYVFLEDIMVKFRDDHSPTLQGKPKLFFIQACRGGKVSHKVEVQDPPLHPEEVAPQAEDTLIPLDEQEDDALMELEGKIKNWKPKPYVCFSYPCYKDYLVSCSTLPGYFSFRSTERSWYFRELFDELILCADRMEINEIMERINLKIAYSYRANTLASKNPNDWVLDGKGQMPWVMSMLTKQVYLKPKTKDGAAKLRTLKWSMKT